MQPAKTTYASITPFVTKDGSQIRELMHPAQHAAFGSRAQSLAEATIVPGAQTELHKHHRAEEIYHITQGAGRMTLGADQFDVVPGDTICIPPGTPHCITVDGQTLQDQTVTIRDRDTLKQERIALKEVAEVIRQRVR